MMAAPWCGYFFKPQTAYDMTLLGEKEGAAPETGARQNT